jgi:hypothetical protein
MKKCTSLENGLVRFSFYIQSAVDEQRRIIGCHCLFFILLYIKHKNIGAKDKKQITITAIFSFIALQIIGLIYLS